MHRENFQLLTSVRETPKYRIHNAVCPHHLSRRIGSSVRGRFRTPTFSSEASHLKVLESGSTNHLALHERRRSEVANPAGRSAGGCHWVPKQGGSPARLQIRHLGASPAHNGRSAKGRSFAVCRVRRGGPGRPPLPCLRSESPLLETTTVVDQASCCRGPRVSYGRNHAAAHEAPNAERLRLPVKQTALSLSSWLHSCSASSPIQVLRTTAPRMRRDRAARGLRRTRAPAEA